MEKQPDFRLKDRVWSGCSTLYVKEPMRSFVVEVELASPVEGDIMQAAVNDVLERAPFFADALVERDTLFYYAENPLPFEVSEGPLRKIAGPETNWHNIDVTFEGNVASFAMYHPFCDGLGLNQFIEATLNRYFSRKDGVDYAAEGLRVPGQPVLEGEQDDPFAHGYDVEMTPEMGAILAKRGTGGFLLPEAEGEHLDCVHAMTVRVVEKDFVDFARSRGSSPAPTLASILAEAIFSVHPEATEPIAAMIPFSGRAAAGTPNTFKNASSAAVIHFDPELCKSLPFDELAQAARAELKEGANPELVRFMFDAAHKMYAASDELDTFAAKCQTLDRMSNYIMPIVVDYVGGLRSQGFEEQIVSVRYLAMPASAVNPGISLLVTATAGYFNLVLTRTMATDVYDKAFLTQLDKLGISYEIVGEGSYSTPKSGLIPALGLD